MTTSLMLIDLNVTGTADAICLFSVFTIERDAKFQLRVNENREVFFFLSKFWVDPPEFQVTPIGKFLA